jgi:uncharacterized protein YqgC (DUF456 family)
MGNIGMDESAYLNWNLASALVLLSLCFGCWVLNSLSAPGNWLMVLCAGVYSWLMPPASPYAFGWLVVATMAVLAGIGEILELATSAIGTRKAGGSRKGTLLAVVGSFVGSITGVILAIPVIGSLVGALFFAGCGSMLGAYLGERWDGKGEREAWRVGWASFWGRLIGSLAKLLTGLVMIAIAVLAMVF